MSTSHPILGDEGDEVWAEVLEHSAKHTLLVYYDGVNFPIKIEIGDADAVWRLADKLHQIASYVDFEPKTNTKLTIIHGDVTTVKM